MATLQELENGLRKAHEAGNAEHAKAFANEIRKMRTAPAEAPVQDMAPVEVRPDPAEGMGFYEKYRAGLGKSMVDTYQGLKQFGVDAIGELAGDRTGLTGSSEMAGLITGEKAGSNAVTRWADRKGAELRGQEAERRRLDEPLMDTGAGQFGNVVGTVSQMFAPGAALRGTAVGRAMLPATVRGNALQGLALGAVQPVAAEGERAQNTALGGLAGGAGAAVPKAGGALLRAFNVGPNLSAAEAGAGRIIQKEATNKSALDQLIGSNVPGVNRTLGESTGDAGLSALENTIRAGNRGMFDQIDTSNNAARVAVLRNIAGDSSQRAAATQARTTASIPALDRASKLTGVDTDPVLKQVDDLIQKYTGNKPMQDALRNARSGIKASNGNMAYMENARQYIGKLIDGTADGTMVKLPDMIAAKDALTDTMRKASPDFSTYLDNFKAYSKPINRMDAGTYLLDSGSAGVRDKTGLERIMPGTFAKAEDLDKIAAKATGFDRAKAADVFLPEDIANLGAIQDDMQRQFARQSSATVGPQTFERFEIGGRIAKRGIASGLARVVPGVNSAMDYFEQQATARVKERLAYLIANPAEAQRVLSALSKSDRAVVTKALIQLGGRSGAAVPALAE